MTHVRREVERSAAPVFRSWLDSLGDAALPNFGFASRAEARSARLLMPIPYVLPPRKLALRELETFLAEAPGVWLVPAAVGTRVVCLVSVNAAPGERVEAVEFGKTWAANRLDAGIRAAGSPPQEQWSGFRIVTFVSPRIELLAFRGGDRKWKWWRLTGAEQASASPLSNRELTALLAGMGEPERDLLNP